MNGLLTNSHRSGGDTGFPRVEENVPLSHVFFIFENPCIKVDAHPHAPSPNLRMKSSSIQNIPNFRKNSETARKYYITWSS